MTTRTKAILGLTSVFLLGALIGAGALGLYVTTKVEERQSLRDPVRFREHFIDRLDLDNAQRDSVADELARTYEDLIDVRRTVDEEYQIIFDSLDRRIGPLLTGEQRSRLREQRNRFLQRRRRAVAPSGTPMPTRSDSHDPSSPGDSAIAGGAIDATSDEEHDALRSEEEASTASNDTKGGIAAEGAGADDPSRRSEDSLDGDGTVRPKLIEQIAQRLDLTPEQQNELESILRKSMKRAKTIRREFASNPDAMRRQLRINRMKTDRHIRNLLTEEQRPAYETLKERLIDTFR